MASIEKAVVTCAVTGVLTNPQIHPVPVTVEQMAASAGEAFDAGASLRERTHFGSDDCKALTVFLGSCGLNSCIQ